MEVEAVGDGSYFADDIVKETGGYGSGFRGCGFGYGGCGVGRCGIGIRDADGT